MPPTTVRRLTLPVSESAQLSERSAVRGCTALGWDGEAMVRRVRVGVMGAGDGSQKLEPIIEYGVLPKVRKKCFSIGKT